jgi:hypothetical protein
LYPIKFSWYPELVNFAQMLSRSQHEFLFSQKACVLGAHFGVKVIARPQGREKVIDDLYVEAIVGY